MEKPNKLKITSEYVMWGENQIGFFEDKNEILLGISNEDFENGEFEEAEIREILFKKDLIIAYLKSCGYKLTIDDN